MNVFVRRGAAVRSAGALLSLALLAGCFQYVPVRNASPRPGTRVQVFLNDPQEVRTGEVTANDVVEIRGEVVSADSARLLLSAFGLTSRSGYEHVATGQTTMVPRLNIAGIRENRVSPLRTGFLAGAVVLAGAIFVSEVANPRGSGPGGGGPPGSGN